MKATINKRIMLFYSLLGTILFITSGVFIIQSWDRAFRTRTRDLGIWVSFSGVAFIICAFNFSYDEGSRLDHQWSHFLHGHDIHISTEEIAINGWISRRVNRWRRKLERFPQVRVQNYLFKEFERSINRESCSTNVKKLPFLLFHV